MATMGIQYYSGPIEVVAPLEANSQTFVAGDLVYLNSGAVTLATTSQETQLFGVALKAGTNVTTGNANIPVCVIAPETLFIAQLDTTTAVAYAGEDYGLNYTSGSMSVDLGDTSSTSVRIEKLDTRDAVGTSGGRVVIRFQPATMQFMAT